MTGGRRAAKDDEPMVGEEQAYALESGDLNG